MHLTTIVSLGIVGAIPKFEVTILTPVFPGADAGTSAAANKYLNRYNNAITSTELLYIAENTHRIHSNSTDLLS